MVNQVFLIGRIGQDPELKQFQGGAELLSFSLATSRKWKNKAGQWEEETQWHRVQAWGKLASIYSSLLNKGDLVNIQGEIKYGKYTGKDGVERYTTDISAQVIKKLSKSDPKPASNTYDPGKQYQESGTAYFDEEEPVPF